MTTPVSLLPISTPVDPMTGPSPTLPESATTGGNNLFTQLLQGMIVGKEGQPPQPGLPFLIELSASAEIEQQGNILPAEGQLLALSQVVNPFVTVSESEIDGQLLNGNLQAAHEPIAGQRMTAGLAINVAALSSALTAKQVTDVKPGSQQILPATEAATTVLPEMLSGQKDQQVLPGLAGKFAAMAERAALINKADTASLNISQLSTQSGNEATLNLNSLSMLTGSASRAEVAVATPAPVTVTPQNPAWTQQVGERIQWMVNQQMQKAEIRLDPPELGSLELRVVMQKDHAQVTFAAPHAQVRDALEAAIPRLREMLMDQGLNLADVDIGQHSFAEQQQQHNEGEVSAELAEQDGVVNDGDAQAKDNDKSTSIASANGLLDTYV